MDAHRYEVALALASVWPGNAVRTAVWDELVRDEPPPSQVPDVRMYFFGGADLRRDPPDHRSLLQEGFARGTPMGQALPEWTAPPTFTAYATVRPADAVLYGIWFVKGWVDGDGKVREQLIHPPRGGRMPRSPAPEGDQEDGVPDGARGPGATETDDDTVLLMAGWTDDHFDPSIPALFYASVFEIEPVLPLGPDGTLDLPRLDVPASGIRKPVSSKPIWYSPADASGARADPP